MARRSQAYFRQSPLEEYDARFDCPAWRRGDADAPYDDDTDIWDGLAAQRKFDELKGELLIKPVKVGFAAFYEQLGRVGLVEEAPKEWKPVSISGRDLREKLRAGELPDPRNLRPETAKVLIETMRAAG